MRAVEPRAFPADDAEADSTETGRGHEFGWGNHETHERHETGGGGPRKARNDTEEKPA